MKEYNKAADREVHICPILLRTVIFENGKCTEACEEPDCPVAELQKRGEP